ncbi:MAG: type II secretion system F family protein [Coriobacteriales bacterium]|jgi:type IV pilus assembly protein PilC|nr:type II secretion system F family protein [Coriobacteriales bacterium]
MSNKKKELKPAQLKVLFSNLEMITHSGLPLSEGFDILRKNEEEPIEKALMERLFEAVNGGESITAVLVESRIIPNYACSLISIGEKTGRLEETFASLADFYIKRDELAQSIRSSVVYPVSMLVMVFVVVGVLLVQVMPVFDHVFRQLGYEMTGISAGLMQAGTILGQFGFWIAGGIFGLVVIGVILAAIPIGKRFYGALFQNAPITRNLSLDLAAQRFSLAMSSMLSAGLEHNIALEYAQKLVDDKRARRAVVKIQKIVDEGGSFLTALEKSDLYTHKDLALLSIGIKTGADAEAMNQVGEQITFATEGRLERLIAAIEPSLVAIMCILVGLILLSVMLPLMGALTGF